MHLKSIHGSKANSVVVYKSLVWNVAIMALHWEYK